jgi:hypothetical protein
MTNAMEIHLADLLKDLEAELDRDFHGKRDQPRRFVKRFKPIHTKNRRIDESGGSR